MNLGEQCLLYRLEGLALCAGVLYKLASHMYGAELGRGGKLSKNIISGYILAQCIRVMVTVYVFVDPFSAVTTIGI